MCNGCPFKTGQNADKRIQPSRVRLVEEFSKIQDFQNASEQPTVLIIPRLWVRVPPPATTLWFSRSSAQLQWKVQTSAEGRVQHSRASRRVKPHLPAGVNRAEDFAEPRFCARHQFHLPSFAAGRNRHSVDFMGDPEEMMRPSPNHPGDRTSPVKSNGILLILSLCRSIIAAP